MSSCRDYRGQAEVKLAEQVTFGGSGLDRDAAIRVDSAALAELAARDGARVLPLWRGRPLFDAEALALLPPSHPALAAQMPGAVLLGRDAAGDGVWALNLADWPGIDGEADLDEVAHPQLDGPARFADLRSRMAALSPRDAELAATARAVLNWHDSHRFCARCGAASNPVQAGWRRDCPTCGGQHFPRTDPVVIMLVTRGDEVLLGRSPVWPEGMFSLLAGFVEPGETMEAAVRREVFEEVGVVVGPVGYLASQPWPFPASLMLGCRAEVADREASRRFTLDPAEIEAAHWVSRERLARVFAGEDPVMRPPRAGAIAQFLLHNWLADRLD